MTTDKKLETVASGFCFNEGPRWHEGRLWFSDMHGGAVFAMDESGKVEPICEVPEAPSGLGWLPDGRMLIVSMHDRRVLRREADGALVPHADLSAIASWHCNDMVVDAKGRAYVGNFGWDIYTRGTKPVPAKLALVTPDGDVRAVADDLMFPNGTVITPDGQTLVVGESMAARMTAFDIEPDGSLTGRREWGKLEGAVPDGCCLDADGGIWVASPMGHQVVRVVEGGTITDRIPVEHESFACMLGGADRRTLYVCTAESSEPEACKRDRSGRIEAVHVDVPGAGLP